LDASEITCFGLLGGHHRDLQSSKTLNTGCFKKSFTTLKAYRNLYLMMASE